jgi:hypothetical protein
MEVARFLQDHSYDMPLLYMAYDFEGDSYQDGFPKMFKLERRIINAAKHNSFDRDDLIEIAKWGGNHRNINRIKQMDWKFKFTLYVNNEPLNWLKDEPENYICIVKERIPGFSATYSSKLLHFAIPSIFGMLDTWLVRTFGEGDQNHQKYKFLKLIAKNQGTGWAISTPKKYWPSEYGTWIRILNNIADTLNDRKIQCPHPLNYIQSNIRKERFWYPADVETALFSYAYEGRGDNLIKNFDQIHPREILGK